MSDGEQQAVSKICDWASEEGMVDRIEILGFVDYKRSDWIKRLELGDQFAC